MSSTPDPEMEYLQPDFDPNSLTMPKLRGILVAHSVNYPSTAKKGQLVDIFEEHVRPQARKLLSARNRTKRSTRGIVDMPSSAEPSVNGEDDANEDESAPTKTPRKGRRTTRAATEESLDEGPSTITRSGRPSRSARQSTDSSTLTETGRKSSGARRTRLSTATPNVKIEEEEEDPYPDDGASPFSSENVFQSGSSPMPEVEPVSKDKRRRTTGGDAAVSAKRPSSRRQTERMTPVATTTSANGRASTGRRRMREPTPKEESESDEVEDTIEPGEEFTAEETEDLALTERQNGTVIRPGRTKPARPKSTIAKIAPVTLSIALLGGLFTVWRQEKLAVGFCGVGRPALTQLGDVEIPEWARDTVLPTCEPCPPHAYCYADLTIQCEDDFIRTPHPLSLGGLIPLPSTCTADGEKARKVAAVADRAVEELRERNAKFECGELRDEKGKRADTAEVEEPVLKETVSARRSRKMSDEEFEELWVSALPDIYGRDEVLSGDDSTHHFPTSALTRSPHRHLRSTSLAHIPLACALRRSLRLALVKHLQQIGYALTFFALIAYIYAEAVGRREMESRAKVLAGAALSRLAEQSAWSNYYGGPSEQYDGNGATADADAEDGVERYIGVAQLRDDVLRDEFSAKRRRKLWERVSRKVEENANVRSAVREGRTGEVGRVWEWIGAVPALEFGGEDVDVDWGEVGRSLSRPVSAGGGLRRRRSRVSFGKGRLLDSSPLGGAGGYGQQQMRERPGNLPAWEEARPMY